jgi:hypothetical protein
MERFGKAVHQTQFSQESLLAKNYQIMALEGGD